ncbi:MAG TPA: beta-N-acetylhexosaminidase [Vicinamibacteria bacterium]|nr:beta-N-acetylhexosaminidase [Vicinamibacteria bacterium]
MRDVVRRVGQRFAIGFEGHTVSADARTLLREFGVGSVILFARNVDGPEQVAELVRELQEAARDAGQQQPLLVAVDQEGGRVARLREPWTVWPSARAVGRTRSAETAQKVGAAIAAELRACGIAVDFAPVVDVDTNPDNPVIGDRSFGDDPDLVGRLGAAMVKGLQEAGVAACAKHFPGHGDTAVDSHLELPAVDHSRARLADVELRPFRGVIEAGVAMVMTAHVLVREIDDSRPATLSEPMVGGLLRKELGFDGVVATDDLDMQAVAKHWPAAQVGVLAAQAGCDLLCCCRNHDAQVAAIEGLIRALEAGEIPFRQAEVSEKRLRRLKERFLLGYRDPDPKQAREAAGRVEHRALAEEVLARSGLRA